MSWTKRVKHPSEVLKKGDTVKARITNIDVENQRVSLSIKEFMPNEWEDFADSHHAGDTLDGRVVNVTDFGLFIDIYNGLEGLAHVSEIEVPAGAKLEDHFQVGDWVRTRILRIEEDEKKVGLSHARRGAADARRRSRSSRPPGGDAGIRPAGRARSRAAKKKTAEEEPLRRQRTAARPSIRREREGPPRQSREREWEMSVALRRGAAGMPG